MIANQKDAPHTTIMYYLNIIFICTTWSGTDQTDIEFQQVSFA